MIQFAFIYLMSRSFLQLNPQNNYIATGTESFDKKYQNIRDAIKGKSLKQMQTNKGEKFVENEPRGLCPINLSTNSCIFLLSMMGLRTS